jgi:hypothetical protein
MKKISIEYAHIYTNSEISDEQNLSVEVLNYATKNLKRDDFSLVVMVDDYSFPDPTFDYNMFGDWLETKGFRPNFILRESQLIPLCDELIKLINNEKIKKSIIDYIKIKKYPCSLFIASWYLLRLGYLQSPLFPKSETAEKICNILPESFAPFEIKAVEIINCTKYSQAASKIQYRYLEGRLIA